MLEDLKKICLSQNDHIFVDYADLNLKLTCKTSSISYKHVGTEKESSVHDIS